MKWTQLLWMSVILTAATSGKATKNVMPTVFMPNTTPPAHNNNNSMGRNDSKEIHLESEEVIVKMAEDLTEMPTDLQSGDNNSGNELESITEEPEANHSEENDIESDGAENENVSDEIVKHEIVSTTYGPVQGFKDTSGNIISYFDIPYGRFNDTFQSPTNPEPWTEPLKNIKHTVKCPQLDGDTYKGDKNCLTLNVFTNSDNVNASVLFYIHESDFSTGSGDPNIYRPDHLVSRDVVLVLPNYRLGPLGFLCLRNSTAPGNAALKDLTLALEWTKRNIIRFGGDPTNIAVSGDGASAALAGFLALSPKSRNYISKVIAESGTALSHWGIDRTPIDSAQKLADLIRIDGNNDTTIDDLLKETDIENLIKSAKGITLRPCIEQSEEGSFISTTPWKILDSESIELSFIIGTANHAGLLEALKHDADSISEFNKHFTNFLPNDLRFDSTTQMNNIGLNLKSQYFGGGNITLEQSEELSLYHTDASYLGPSLRVARALVEAGARVFIYEFSFVGALNTNLVSLADPPGFGAVRGDIIGYLFPTRIQEGEANQNEESAEKRIVNLISDLWVSFLKTGEPTAEGIEWRPLNVTLESSEDYLSISNTTSAAHGVHPDRLRLWSDIYRQHFVDRNAGLGSKAGGFGVVLALVLMGASKVWVV